MGMIPTVFEYKHKTLSNYSHCADRINNFTFLYQLISKGMFLTFFIEGSSLVSTEVLL